MHQQHTHTLARIASNLDGEPEQTLVFERFLPAKTVKNACEQAGYSFRDRIYNPVVTQCEVVT